MGYAACLWSFANHTVFSGGPKKKKSSWSAHAYVLDFMVVWAVLLWDQCTHTNLVNM